MWKDSPAITKRDKEVIIGTLVMSRLVSPFILIGDLNVELEQK